MGLSSSGVTPKNQFLRNQITKAPIPAYYDPPKNLVLQFDANNNGLGATLLQDRKPLAYKSRSITDAETRYPTLEKELLTII